MKLGMSMGKFEAELDSDVCDQYNNANLILTMKLGFRQINPAGNAASGTYHDYGNPTRSTRKIIKWTVGSWELWKKNFVSSAQNYWHGKFWLVNNFDLYTYEKNGVKYRPNIWCGFKLVGKDAGAEAQHHTIDVVRLDPTEKWFGSHETLYDSKDTDNVVKGRTSANKPIMQRAHVHEVGHLLGLDHVDVGKANCPVGSNTNLAPCYGVADPDKQSVMGQGMQLRMEHAVPWRRAMITLSGKGSLMTLTDWEAKRVRHYPRIPSEVASNAAIINRPTRK